MSKNNIYSVFVMGSIHQIVDMNPCQMLYAFWSASKHYHFDNSLTAKNINK